MTIARHEPRSWKQYLFESFSIFHTNVNTVNGYARMVQAAAFKVEK